MKSSEEVLASEKKFHDEVFESKARTKVGRFYSINGAIEANFDREVFDSPKGKSYLEYGCGMGSKLLELDKVGSSTYGIDISDYAISQLTRKAKEVGARTTYLVMNAENLDFDDQKFDVIYGSGILHHLNLERAFKTLSRKLKKDGKAVFIEPLGHNPLINGFRKKTPDIRTADEHPLLVSDLEFAKTFFGKITVNYYYLTTLALPFLFGSHSPAFLVKLFNGLDSLLFKFLPFLRKHAWQVLIKMESPKA